MICKLITTTHKESLVSVLLDEKERVIEVHPFRQDVLTDVGNIYVGKVKTIKKNIQAAFVDIGKSENVFVSLQESKHIHYAHKIGMGVPLVPGDEILVQIQKDAHKTKLAKAITDFCLTGRYVVLTTDKSAVFISSKITQEVDRIRLKQLLNTYKIASYGFIARTNCLQVDDSHIKTEVDRLIKQYENLIKILPYRKSGQRIFTQGTPYMTLLLDLYDDEVTEYIYDDPSIYKEISLYLEENHPEMIEKVKLIDQYGSLYTFYSMDIKIGKLLKQKIWLKSGASIIIEHTEALTVIDVNTEKSLSKKKVAETIFNTNMEAATEIIRQLRGRNISGIIIIDFIDMQDSEDKNKLLQRLRYLSGFDRIKTTVIDMTALGLVEMTRKKVQTTLFEQWNTND